MLKLFVILCLAVLTLISAVIAEVVTFEHCDETPSVNCDINQVTIIPCPEAEEEAPCKVKKGKNAEITINYTPKFASPTLTAGVYWDTGIVDLPFPGLDTDACNYAPCPVVAEVVQNYTYGLKILKSYPSNSYTVKWKLTGAEEKDECCLLVKITVH